MKSFYAVVTAIALSVSLAPAARAQTANSAVVSDASVSQGEIKKVDADAGKVTIKHGELKNINMGAMTMVFEVADKSVLSQLKAGDAITFIADNTGGQLTARDVKLKK